MEVMVAVQSGTLLSALRGQLKRRVSARRGGDCNEVPQAIQERSCTSPSNCVTPFACKLLSELGFGFRKASVAEYRVFASHSPSDEVQNEAQVRGSTPVSANDLGKNTAAMAILIKFTLYWASLIFLRAMQFDCIRLWLSCCTELELELIQTQMAQKPMLRAEVGMRVLCANNTSAE